MSHDKYIHETLTLPSELPLFNYNINFDGLRKLLEDVNVKTNNNQNQIQYVKNQLNNKLTSSLFQKQQKKLASAITFGQNTNKYIEKNQVSSDRNKSSDLKEMELMDQFCWKTNKIASIVQFLLVKQQEHEEKIQFNEKKHEKIINQSFRRIEEKMNSNLQTFNKTMSLFFTQSNEKTSELHSSINMNKMTADNKFNDIEVDLKRKVNQNGLKTVIESAEQKIKRQLETQLKTDQMNRFTALNQYQNKLKQLQKDVELKNKFMSNKIQEFSQKVTKALPTSLFQIEKHKIYEKLSQFKNKADQLLKKNGEFVQFRKNYLTNNEKSKQEIIGLNEQIRKLSDKGSGFSKMENMADMLANFNPHLICQIGEEVKLHEKQIGKMEKQLLHLENELKANQAPQKMVPEVNGGQNSDMIQKIIKEFMSNMDFEGRVKRSEKDIYELKKKNDSFAEIEKKIYLLSKEIDMGAVMKELRKKCDQENTRKDTKILDGKIEQLFQFYKQLRREIEDRRKTVKTIEPFDNASLTTKKLHSTNCISCLPSTPNHSRRTFSKNKLEMSLDYNLQSQKNTVFTKLGK